MKKHQFRYVLSFLILTLFVFATLSDSQESTEQLTAEPNPTEQSAEESNPSESQFDTLKENIKMLEFGLDALKDSSENSFQIFVIITVAFIILISVFVIFSGRHSLRQQRSMLDETERRWEIKLDDSLQRWDGRLQLISQQGNESTQKLAEMESNQSMISDELEKFQNIIAGIGSRLDNFDITVANLESEIERILHQIVQRSIKWT